MANRNHSMFRWILPLLVCFFSAFSSKAQTTIVMEKDGGVYRIPCVVNGVRMKFIFDTGASTVCISQRMAEFLYDNDYLTKDDIRGKGQSVVADGSIVDNLYINLRDIEISGLHLHDVEAIVMAAQESPLLLGQSAIQKLGPVTISGDKLIINDAKGPAEDLSKILKDIDYYLDMDDFASAGTSLEKLKDIMGCGNLLMEDISNLFFCYFMTDQHQKTLSLFEEWRETSYFSETPTEITARNYARIYDAEAYALRNAGNASSRHSAIRILEKKLDVVKNHYPLGTEELLNDAREELALTENSIGEIYYLEDNMTEASDHFKSAMSWQLGALGLTSADAMNGGINDLTLSKIMYALALSRLYSGDDAQFEIYMGMAVENGSVDATKYLRTNGIYDKIVNQYRLIKKNAAKK